MSAADTAAAVAVVVAAFEVQISFWNPWTFWLVNKRRSVPNALRSILLFNPWIDSAIGKSLSYTFINNDISIDPNY